MDPFKEALTEISEKEDEKSRESRNEYLATVADSVWVLYSNFTGRGFSEDQAFTLARDYHQMIHGANLSVSISRMADQVDNSDE